MKGGIDADVERLYQLPLEDFTAARNALAKGSGKRSGEIRALGKPPVPAWAVNQVYWRRRPAYDALIEAAQEARRAHAAVLSGRTADVRGAGKEHDARVAAALDAALEILRESAHPATDATRQAILTTLRALPADEPHGQLTRTLQPGGFEALAGLSIRGAKVPTVKAAQKIAEPRQKPESARTGSRDTKAIAKARDAVASASRALKLAEHGAQREEFERARAARDADKTEKAVADAKKAVEDAESDLRDAQDAAAAAAKKKHAADRRAREAEAAVAAAQAALDGAQRKLDAQLR
jgi:hypothetical protein